MLRKARTNLEVSLPWPVWDEGGCPGPDALGMDTDGTHPVVAAVGC